MIDNNKALKEIINAYCELKNGIEGKKLSFIKRFWQGMRGDNEREVENWLNKIAQHLVIAIEIEAKRKNTGLFTGYVPFKVTPDIIKEHLKKGDYYDWK